MLYSFVWNISNLRFYIEEKCSYRYLQLNITYIKFIRFRTLNYSKLFNNLLYQCVDSVIIYCNCLSKYNFQITDPDCYEVISKFSTKVYTITNINYRSTTPTIDKSRFVLWIKYILHGYDNFALSRIYFIFLF